MGEILGNICINPFKYGSKNTFWTLHSYAFKNFNSFNELEMLNKEGVKCYNSMSALILTQG